ncbi:MAG: hypothetical protein AAF481_01845 [Acidobacteriota bacterium]
MPDQGASSVEYRAFVRDFDRQDGRDGVLYVIATMSFPDSGWTAMIVPQADRPDEWRLLVQKPPYRDGSRTYVIASGTTEHQMEHVPKVIRVFNVSEETNVKVEPWD